MRTPLKIALAVAVAGAVWVSTQSSDDGVELASPDKRGASSSSRANERSEAPEREGNNRRANVADRSANNSRIAAAAKPASGAASNAPAWTDTALAEGVQAWRQRSAEAQALPPARAMTQATPSAWASLAPPPPPKVKQVAPPPPPPPTAPPFPHAWIGRINDDTVVAKAAPKSAQPAASQPAPRPIQRAVLAGPVSTWVVTEGDVIEGQWRVDSIQDRTMTLTYLPLQLSQTVTMK